MIKTQQMSSIVVRIDKELKEKLQEIATKDERSLSNYIRLVLKKVVEEKEKDANPKAQ